VACGRPRLTSPPVWRGVADAEAEDHEGARRQAQKLGDAHGVIAHGADINGAEAIDWAATTAFLRGERCIDASHHMKVSR